MSDKSDLFDYEPLSRRTNAVEEEGFTVQKERTSISEFGAKFDKAEVKENSTSNRQLMTSGTAGGLVEGRPANGQREGWILKRGHTLSFAGLFVFTFLVFVRPYELSPSLAWLSRSALVTAIITLLIFIPTQLGLENRITVRPREVNLVLLLLLLALISVPFALDNLRAWNGFVEYSKVVIMFVVMVNVVRTEKRLKALLLLVL